MTIKDIFHHLNKLSDEELNTLCPDEFAENMIMQLLNSATIKRANFEIAAKV